VLFRDSHEGGTRPALPVRVLLPAERAHLERAVRIGLEVLPGVPGQEAVDALAIAETAMQKYGHLASSPSSS
jgi:hypothetical protein